MGSPIKRRQLVRGGIDLDLYAAAGKTPNILGEAIGGIGVALGEAFDKAKDKANAIDQEEQEEQDLLNKITQTEEEEEFDPNSVEYEDPNDITADEDLDDLINNLREKGYGPNAAKPASDDTYTYEMLGKDAKAEFLKKNPGQFTAAEAHANKTMQEAEAYNVKKYGTKDPTKNVAGVNNIVNVKKTKDGEYDVGSAEGKPVVAGSTTYGSKGVVNPSLYMGTPGKRLNSPLDRRRVNRQLSQPRQSSLANVFGGPSQTSYLVGNRSVPSDAISRGETSQYTEGRTFVEKERRLSAPAWMGIGAAAVEGYNMGVEKRNYEKQVQADLTDYYNNEFAGLTAERTGNDLFDNSVRELLFNSKKELGTHLAEREKWYAEGRGAEWSAKLPDLKKPANELLSLVEGVKGVREQWKKDSEADNIDYDAMSAAQKDENLSVVRGGNIGVANVEGMGTSLIGQTRGGMPYLKSLSAIIGEGQGPKYITKKNAFDYVKTVVDQIRKDPTYETYEDVNGVKVKRPMTLEQLTPHLNRMFDAELDSPSVTRAYASPNNWDEDGLTADQFDKSLKMNKDPKDFVKKKFLEVANDLLAPYFGSKETTRKAAAITGGRNSTRSTAAQREDQRQASLLSEAARIVGIAGDSMPGEDGPRGPNYNLLLGRKGVGRVKRIGNELIVYGKVAGSSLAEDEMKRIPLKNQQQAAEIIANFLSEDKTYKARGGSFDAAEYINTFNANQGK